jgi:3-oxoacyl-[acyl-carrier-protein] synthase-3
MKRTVVKGTGRYVPPRAVSNDDMTQWMETSDEWIQKRTGIEKRYWVSQEGGVGASDLTGSFEYRAKKGRLGGG